MALALLTVAILLVLAAGALATIGYLIDTSSPRQ